MANENIYQSRFTGAEMDAFDVLTEELAAAIAALELAVAAKYSKPQAGIPASDLDADVNAALAKANSAIQSLADYYTKSEIDAMMSAVNSQEYETAATLPTASASTMGKIYLIGPDGSGYYSYYFTSYDGSAYSWVGPLGTTEIDLSQYASKAELNQLDQKIDGNATKELVWSNGYINTNGLINNSTVSKFTQPFVLKAGERVTVGTNNTNIGIICTTSADALQVGDTVTLLQKTSGTAGFETHTFEAEVDTKIVLCVKWSDYTLDFYDTDNIKDDVANLEGRVDTLESALLRDEWVPQDITSGPYKPTSQNTGNNGARLEGGQIFAASSGDALVTDIIEIDHTKRYKLRTLISNYFDGIAYYNQDAYVGRDVFYTSGSDTIVEAELTIPANATHFRLATKNITTAYSIAIYSAVVKEVALKEELDPVAEQVGQNTDDIQTLYGIVEQGDVPPENAVKIVPTKDLYLGANILNPSQATFDPTYWAVINGVVKYLGGGSSATPFTFSAATTEGQRYLAELTAQVETPGFEDLFNIQIGDGAIVDTYDGTESTRGGVVSDGGSFKIVPASTKAFDLTAVALSPCLPSASAQGYERTVTVTVSNVSAGNSAQTLIDGKWNVAIGPISSTFAENISASRSVGIGVEALRKLKFGKQNVAIGTFAAQQLEDGEGNICIGSDAMWQAKRASYNVVIGRSALGKTGEYSEMLRNIAIGKSAMGVQQSNSKDSVSIGYEANLYGVSNSVFIGNGSTTTQANSGISNVICIGYNARATKSNQCVLGNSSVSEFVLGNKKLVFNNDNTITWETVS